MALPFQYPNLNNLMMKMFFFQDKFLEEEETGNFFGFNFNSTVARDAGILTALTGSLNYLYDNVIDSYVENVYTLVVQEYTIATIKVKSTGGY